MSYEWIGFFILGLIAWLVLLPLTNLGLPFGLKRLLVVGLVLRIFGSLSRYEVLTRFYGGVGDAVVYFNIGNAYAQQIRVFDFSIFDSSLWWAGRWWGTQFVRYVSGFVLALIGPSMRAEFLFFSLVSFAGLGCFALAFHRAYPHVELRRYAAWLFLWPSLWFWPSSVGKDALMLLAIGLVTAGYVGSRNTLNWPFMIAGLALASAIRPHVAGATVVGLAAAQWLSIGRKMNVWGFIQAVALLGLAFFVVTTALGQLGLEEVDVEGLQEYMELHAGLSSQGGSNIGAPTSGWAQVPMAFVNILLRPFPWEAHNPPAMVASLELVVFWFLIWRRRRRVGVTLRHWRSNRLLRLGLPLLVLYVAMIGLVFGNLGIIARQRVVVLPFLLLFLEAVPQEYFVRLARRHRLLSPRPDTTPRGRLTDRSPGATG